jgi:hypothetical protein
MSSATVPVSELVSEDWQLTADNAPRPLALVVQLRRYAHILPYFRLVYVEGDNSQVKIAFASHLVTVSGHGLAALLAALSSQQVARIMQPMESEATFRAAGPTITGITVQQFE